MECTKDMSTKFYEHFFTLVNILQNQNIGLKQNIDILKSYLEVKAMMDWNFNFHDFYDKVCEVEKLPMQGLWNMHVLQIVPLDVYILNVSSKNRFWKFKEEICKFFLKEFKHDELIARAGLMSYFINKTFLPSVINSSESELTMLCSSLLKEINQCVFSIKEDDCSIISFQSLSLLKKCGILEEQCLNAYKVFSLKQFLRTGYATQIEAFAAQGNWGKMSDPFHFLDLIKTFMDNLDCSTVEGIVVDSLNDNSTNWKHFIVIIASFLEIQKSATFLISKIASDILIKAFEEGVSTFLFKAVIIGRQLTLNTKAPFSIAYHQWFQKNFHDNIHFKNQRVFSFCIQALTDLLPFENNLEIIKMYLEKPFQSPPGCNLILADYITLLKTRVKDLQPNIKINHEEILQKVLLSFKDTEKVPSFIIEASLMQKHMFLNEFLPALLLPRVIPKIPDVREKFIEELNKAGKIPNAFLQKYKLACQQMEEEFISDINTVYEDSIEFIEEIM